MGRRELRRSVLNRKNYIWVQLSDFLFNDVERGGVVRGRRMHMEGRAMPREAKRRPRLRRKNVQAKLRKLAQAAGHEQGYTRTAIKH